MPSVLSESVGSLGVQIASYTVRLVNSTGSDLVAGQVVQLDLGQTVATSTLTNSPTGCFSNVIKAVNQPSPGGAAGQVRGGIFAVATQAVTNGQAGLFVLRGVLKAYIWAAVSGVTAKGSALRCVAGDVVLNADATQNYKMVGLSLENTSASAISAATAELALIYFNGVEGVGL